VSETTKKVVAGGAVVAAVALGYLALRPGEAPPEVAPLPQWRQSAPQVAAVERPAARPLVISRFTFGAAGAANVDGSGALTARTVTVGGTSPMFARTTALAPALVHAGGGEQAAMLTGQLDMAKAAFQPPAAPAWLDGWFWPSWRGAAPVASDDVCPVVVWSASRHDDPPARPHLVAVTANDATPLKPLAEYLAADAQAVAVIVGWEETNHDFRPNATLDAPRAEAVAKVVRAARPGLPVWLLCSLTVTGSPEQAMAKVEAVRPDALVLYGLFARAAWESDKVVETNLAKGRKLLPGKAIYVAGPRLTGDALKAAVERARRLGWGGMLCDGSAR